MAKPSMDELDQWREALARADAGEDCDDADGGDRYTRPFVAIRREFLTWFASLERIAAAVSDPFAPGAAEALASYHYDDDKHHDLGSMLLDLVDTGRALALRGDRNRLASLRRALYAPRQPGLSN